MAEFKFPCSQCGQHIQCDISYVGMQINCPVCQKPIVVPQPPRAAALPAPAKSKTWRNVLLIAGLVVALAGLILGGWFGFAKIKSYIKRGYLPSGVIALWAGDGNGKDSVGENKAKLRGIDFTHGKVGFGFNFNGENSTISVSTSKSLNVGTGQGFTLECWIAPTSATNSEPLIEWRASGGINNGAHFWLSTFFAGVGGAGCVYANIVDTNGGSHIFASPSGIVQAGVFQHVAITYDKSSGIGKIYYNGSLVASSNLGVFTPKTDTTLLLGRRMDFGDFYYQGTMDEMAIFNRALSASEIKAIYEKQK